MERVGEMFFASWASPLTTEPHLYPGVIHLPRLCELLHVSDPTANNTNVSAVCLWVVLCGRQQEHSEWRGSTALGAALISGF